MSLFEFHLEKPAFKRVEATEGETADTPDADTTDEAEDETTDSAANEGRSNRRPGWRSVALLVAVAVAVLAIRRRRS